MKVIPKAVLRAVTNVLAKFAEVFLPAFVFCIQFEGLDAEELQGAHITAPDPSQRAVILQEVEKLFDMMTEFLSHPSLEFRHLVLDFWFSLIGNQFTQQQAQLESAAAELFALKSQFVLQEDTATGGGGVSRGRELTCLKTGLKYLPLLIPVVCDSRPFLVMNIVLYYIIHLRLPLS